MKQLFSVIGFLFLLLTSCTWGEKPASSTGKISGTVIDSSKGSAIPFANVITEPPTSSVTTGADGKYSISDVHPGEYTVVAIKLENTSRKVQVAVRAGETTIADLHFGMDQTHSPKATPPLTPVATQVVTPVLFGSNMLANGSLDENDFGVMANWAQTNIDLYRWYLVQDVQPGTGAENTRWVERVELFEYQRGYGLKSTDYQNCNYFCSTSAVQIVPAQENIGYTLSAEAIREQGQGGKLYMDFLNSNRGRIKAFSKGGYSEQWSRQEKIAVAPKGTRYIRVILYTDNKHQGIVYWDNVELQENEQH